MTVRIGFIGTGGNAQGHMRRLAAMGDVKLAAFMDINAEVVEKVAAEYGGRAFTDAERMLGEVELDGVYICIPPFAHGAPERAVLKHNLPLFVEKPVHLDIGEAREFAREIETRGLVSASGFQERYIDVIDRAKAELAGRPVGLAMGYWMGGVARPAWWRKKALSGGQAVEQTIHVFDMARYLIGEVKAIQAVGRTGLQSHLEGYDIEDASAANLVFENGAIATIFSACFVTIAKGRPAGLDIFCPDRTLKYIRRTSLEVITPDGSETFEIKNDFSADSDRAFIEAIREKNPGRVRCTYPDSVRSLEVVLGVNKALETGQTVTLPL